jgi:hypothetical protein
MRRAVPISLAARSGCRSAAARPANWATALLRCHGEPSSWLTTRNFSVSLGQYTFDPSDSTVATPRRERWTAPLPHATMLAP